MALTATTLNRGTDTVIQQDVENSILQCVEGTLQRVNYAKRELTVIAQGKVWYFTVAPDCRFSFDDQPAILRCFHPLDQVKAIYEFGEEDHVLKALYAWERR